MTRSTRVAVALTCLLSGTPCAASGAVGQGEPWLERALSAAFPGATEFRRQTDFLTDEARARVADASRSAERDVPSVVTRYEVVRGSELLGFAYVDAHIVRTHREVLLLLIAPDGVLRRVELLRFAEPPEYRPPDAWLSRFEGRADVDRIDTRREIPPLTGATLTARAVTAAARRTLAIHRLLAGTADPRIEAGDPGT